jgi:hypothetical protein
MINAIAAVAIVGIVCYTVHQITLAYFESKESK